jgi:hypothetical protein
MAVVHTASQANVTRANTTQVIAHTVTIKSNVDNRDFNSFDEVFRTDPLLSCSFQKTSLKSIVLRLSILKRNMVNGMKTGSWEREK